MEEVAVIVEVVGGAEERPEVRVVDVEDLSRLVLALGQVTDAEADEVLRAAGLGRLADGGSALLDAAAVRAAAGPGDGDRDRRWAELAASLDDGSAGGLLRVEVQSAAGA
ncbi:hypothetical protein [Blastococcus sp. SYSU D00695]